MSIPEARRTRRISYQAPVGGVLIGEQRLLNMVSTNLSVGGMYATVEVLPRIGAELVCNLATAGGQSAIQVSARVARHAGEHGVGIEFVDLSEEQSDELCGLVGLGLEIPRGEQSAAVYELMELEMADTARTVMDQALDDAVGCAIEEAMDEVDALASIDRDDDSQDALPSIDAAIELPAQAPVPAIPVDLDTEPAFTRGPASPRVELVIEETDKVYQRTRESRSWLLAAAVGTLGAIGIGMMGFGLFQSSESSEGRAAVASAEDSLDDKRQRVLALVEGEAAIDAVGPSVESELAGSARPGDDGGEIAARRERAAERIRAAALRDSEESEAEQPAVGGPEVEPRAPETKPGKSVAKEERASAPSLVKRQVLNGVIVRESAESVLVRLPIEGSVENAHDYVMNEPAALAVNLPFAQPAKGYVQSIEPQSDAVRLIWVRERLGGLHLRVFFHGERPECEVQTAVDEVVVRCRR